MAKRTTSGKPKNQIRGIRIAGTLLAYFRARHELMQDDLADALHVTVDAVRHAERGDQSYDFINRNIGVIADKLGLTGQAMYHLQGATRADDFLRWIRATLRTEEEYPHKARAFQSLLILPEQETRHWLRVVFGHNRLYEHFRGSESPDPEPTEPHFRNEAKRILTHELVDSPVLQEIRAKIAVACDQARGAESNVSQFSQMLLFRARSVAALDPRNQEHKNAVRSLLETLAEVEKAKDTDYVVKRVLSQGLCELGRAQMMCSYLAATEGAARDESENLEFLMRRSADSGDGMKALECTLNFLIADDMRKSAPMCALDLRTMSQLVARHWSRAKTHDSTIFQNLQLTGRLLRHVAAFRLKDQPRWLTTYSCSHSPSCREIADRSANIVLAGIAEFTEALPEIAAEMHGAVPATDSSSRNGRQRRSP